MVAQLRIVAFVHYAGCVTKDGDQYRPVVRHNKKTHKRSFSTTKYGEEQAKNLAELARREISNRLGLTVRVFMKNESAEIKGFIAGFLDGDGCIGFEGNFQGRVRFAQSRNVEIPPILIFIQNKYGGSIAIQKEPTGVVRRQYSLRIHGLHSLQILYDLIPFLIIKREKARMLYQHLCGKSTLSQQELYEWFKVRKGPTYYNTVTIPPNRVTNAYISGLFDAEGSIVPRGPTQTTVKVTIAQKSSVPLLEHIGQLFVGSVRNQCLLDLHGQNGMNLLAAVRPLSIVKRAQIDWAFDMREYLGVRKTEEDHAYIAQLRKLITDDKHA